MPYHLDIIVDDEVLDQFEYPVLEFDHSSKVKAVSVDFSHKGYLKERYGLTDQHVKLIYGMGLNETSDVDVFLEDKILRILRAYIRSGENLRDVSVTDNAEYDNAVRERFTEELCDKTSRVPETVEDVVVNFRDTELYLTALYQVEEDGLKERELKGLGTNKLAEYFKILRLVPHLDLDEQKAYLEKMKKGDKRASKYFVRSFQRMIWNRVKYFKKLFPEISLLGMISEANDALADEIEAHLKGNRSHTFSTKFYHVLGRKLRDYAQDTGHVITINPNFYDNSIKKVKAEYERAERLSILKPTYEQLAHNLNISLKDVIRVVQLSKFPVIASEAKYDENKGKEKEHELFVSSIFEDCDKYLELRQEILFAINEILSGETLRDKRRRVIIQRRFFDEEPCTMEDLAKEFDVSSSLIDAEEKRARKKLAQFGHKYLLRELLEEFAEISRKIR